MVNYTNTYYKKRASASEISATAIVPLVNELLRPTSVIDIGCGTGTWLKIWKDNGVKKIKGIDGKWVDKTLLSISQSDFIAHDLSKPLNLEEKYDLVTSLEVAEHIPEENANIFVQNLINHGDIILFSAAIPFQGGTNHYNEQWPEYWIKIFSKYDFIHLDPIRRKVWNDDNVKIHYRQNVFLFIRSNVLHKNSDLMEERKYALSAPISQVHPLQYEAVANPDKISLRKYCKLLPVLVTNYFKKII